MATSRQKILNYITEQGNVTVDELSREFRVTQANIRHHLSILMDQGNIVIVGSRLTTQKGRPFLIFSAAQSGPRNELENLTDSLLSSLLSEPLPEYESRLETIAASMLSNYQVDSSNPTRRLYSSIRVLNQMNYCAHWEAHVDNPRIMLDRCPYRALLQHHPELCQLDKYILENLLTAPVEQVEMNSPNMKGAPQCVFIVKK